MISANNERSLASVVNELKQEIKEFIDTRYQMFASELRDKVKTWKAAVPMLVLAAALVAVAFLMLSVALVAAIAVLVGWGWSFLIVGVFYLLLGGLVGWMAYREITTAGMVPERTLRVLREDQVWLQNEARS